MLGHSLLSAQDSNPDLPTAPSRFVVQIGVFSIGENAVTCKTRVEMKDRTADVRIVRQRIKGQLLNVVRVERFDSAQDASTWMKTSGVDGWIRRLN